MPKVCAPSPMAINFKFLFPFLNWLGGGASTLYHKNDNVIIPTIFCLLHLTLAAIRPHQISIHYRFWVLQEINSRVRICNSINLYDHVPNYILENDHLYCVKVQQKLYKYVTYIYHSVFLESERKTIPELKTFHYLHCPDMCS